MDNLHDIIEPYVAEGTVPGAVGLVAAGTGPRWRPSALPTSTAPPR